MCSTPIRGNTHGCDTGEFSIRAELSSAVCTLSITFHLILPKPHSTQGSSGHPCCVLLREDSLLYLLHTALGTQGILAEWEEEQVVIWKHERQMH